MEKFTFARIETVLVNSAVYLEVTSSGFFTGTLVGGAVLSPAVVGVSRIIVVEKNNDYCVDI